MKRMIAIVTGATGGIGTAISRRLSESYEIIGMCRAADTDRDGSWKAAVGKGSKLVHADLLDHEETTEAVTTIVERYGAPAVLVNCAGVTADGYFSRMNFDDWDRVIRTNLVSLFSVTQPIYRAMCESGAGVIINISSVNGERGQAGQTNYCASKAGVHGFTMALAREGARFGVRVVTVSPGYTATPMIESMRADVQARIVADVPMGRFGEPHEVASMVDYLASDDAEYTTGAIFSINGGLNIR